MDVRVYKCKKMEDFPFKKGVPYIIFCANNHYAVVQHNGRSFLLSDPATEQKHMKLCEIEKIFAGVIIEATPAATFQKKTEGIGEFRYVKKIVTENIKLLLLSLLFTIFAYGISMVVPICLQRIIDMLSLGQKVDYKAISFGIFALMLIYVVFSFLRNKISIALEVSMLNKVNSLTVLHLLKIPYSFFDNRSAGNILYRLGILDHLRDVICTNFVNVIICAGSCICIFLYVVFTFPFLSLPITVLFLLIGIYTLIIAKKTIRLQKEELSASESVSSLRTEIVSNMFQIKCLHLEGFFWNGFGGAFENFRRCFYRERDFGAKTSLGYASMSVFAPIWIVIYCYMFNPTAITVGEIVLIYSMLGMFTNSTYELFGKAITVLQIKSVVFYLNDMLDEPEQMLSGDKQIAEFDTLKMKNVSFHYSRKSELVIRDLNLSVQRGEKVGIVGLSGSGKTTIVKMLSGLYRPSQGNILMNDISLDELDIDSISKLVAVVPQIPIVFNKTIRDNITLGDSSVSDEMIIDALRCACLVEDVNKMPLGLNTYISGQGGNLSGGQIQRLAIARALVHSPQLIIMDEATSSLDATTENMIYQNLRVLSITTIVISHRLSTIIDADCLYYVSKDGCIVSGTHEFLLANNTSYRNLILQQLGPKQQNEIEGGAI